MSKTPPTRRVSQQRLGEIQRYYQEGHRFYFFDDTSCVEITAVDDHLVRVRLAPKGSFLEEHSYALGPEAAALTPTELGFFESDTHYGIATGALKCWVNKRNFEVSFTDLDDALYNRDFGGMRWRENVESGGYHVRCRKRLQPEESFFGLGDKPTSLNLLGQRFTCWNTDAYAFEEGRDPLYRTIPFYLGVHRGRAYGIFFDNTFRSAFDFGQQNPRAVSFGAEGGELRYYFIGGPLLTDVTRHYAHLTGAHPLPPRWALGYHQSRWSYFPEAKLYELARTFREKRIPCDALYLDIDYMDGYRSFTWNRAHFPNPPQMLADLRRDGFRTVVTIAPGVKVDEDYPVYREGVAHDYFCRRGDDYFMEGMAWPGRCRFPDFTDPAVRRWWGDLFARLLDEGVAGVWHNLNEPAVFGEGTFPEDVRHDYDGQRGSHRKAHNVYGQQMVRATREGLRRARPHQRPFTLTRAGYAGMQRYGATRTGDNVSTWTHLQLANLMQQRLSMSGVSFCGADLGGFAGAPDGELYTRWVQLGSLSPLMRTHATADAPAREPWSFGEPYEGICRKFIELRYRLLPYLYSVFREHHTTGLPILRPLVTYEQHRPEHLFRQDEFTFGDKLLVCPVLTAGATERPLYLPEGEWFNFWTDEVLSGGREHVVAAPLDQMPLFVRAGAVVPEYPVMQYTDAHEIDALTLNVYVRPGRVRSFLYEDHGDTFAYEQGIYTEKYFDFEGDEAGFTLRQTQEGLYTPRYDYYEYRLHGLSASPRTVRANGEAVPAFTHDPDARTVSFSVLKSTTEIAVDF